MKQILAKIRDGRISPNKHGKEKPSTKVVLKSRNSFDLSTLEGITGQERRLSGDFKEFDLKPVSLHESNDWSSSREVVHNGVETDQFTYGARYFHECPKIILTSDSCAQCDKGLGDNVCQTDLKEKNLNLRRNSESSDEILRHIVIPTTPEMAGDRKILRQQETTSSAQEKYKHSSLFPRNDIDSVLRVDRQRNKIHQAMIPATTKSQKNEDEFQEHVKVNNFGGLEIGDFHSPKLIPKRKYSKKKKRKSRYSDNSLARERTLSLIAETDEELEMISASSSSEGSSPNIPQEGPESLVDDLDEISNNCSTSKSQNGIQGVQEDIKNTLIHKVVGSGDVTMLESLIKQGCTDLNQVDHEGWPPLLQAVTKGNILCAKMLLLNKAKVNFVHKSTGNCLLHKLVEDGCYDGVEFMIRHGANPNILNHQGWPALHTALRAHQFKCAALLIRSGTDVTYYTHKRIEEYCRVIEMSKGFQQHWQLEI